MKSTKSYKDRGYVSLLVKKNAKDALENLTKHNETFTDALIRIVSFYEKNFKKNGVGFLDQDLANTTSEITPPTTSEESLHND